MAGHTILYRGSLKSCNYCCSYCPFSKHDAGRQELFWDKKQWESFLASYVQHTEDRNIRALLVAPYGEVLRYPWYWEGLARVSALPWTDAAGAQTNLSFPVKKMLSCFFQAGGQAEKLKIWATFHPEMAGPDEFVQNCLKLTQAGAAVSAGAVGVPENLEVIRELRAKLPDEIYLWINRMDGLGRQYTGQEKEAFLEIDPYFFRELMMPAADPSKCRERLFVEADQKLRSCNISGVLEKDWKSLCKNAPQGRREMETAPLLRLHPACTRKRCSCYLAYGGREDFMNQVLFGPYPLFRIPRRPKAVFLDIAGTLTDPAAGQRVSAQVRAGLEALCREQAALFFATTMPRSHAVRICRSIRALFQGGIFAGGAHIRLERQGKTREFFYYLDQELASYLEPFRRQFHFRILNYKNGGKSYKLTLLRASGLPWKEEEASQLFLQLPDAAKSRVRYFIEAGCLQIVAAQADKAEGVRMLCRWLGTAPGSAAAFGDSAEDEAMMRLCGMERPAVSCLDEDLGVLERE